MKWLLVSLLVGCALLLGACGQQESEEPKPAVTEEDVKKEAGEAVESTTSFLSQKFDEYSGTARTKLDEIQGRIGELEAKAREAGEETRGEMEQAVADLKAKAQAVQEKLAQLKGSGAETWEGMKDSLNNALADLEKSYEEARGHFTE